MTRIWQHVGLLAIGGLVLTTAGCSSAAPDPRFVSRTAVRTSRINRLLDGFHAREAEGGARIAHVVDLIEVARDTHARNLERSCKYLQREAAQERAAWPGRRERTRQVIARELAGDLQAADAAIPQMFY